MSALKKFVVIHRGVGPFGEGDVVSDDELHEKGATLDRLLGLRSIRPATELEWNEKHVDLPATVLNPSFQHMLAEKDQQLARQAARINELENHQSSARLPPVPPPAHPQADAAASREKDQIISDLQSRLRALEATSQAQAAAARQQQAQAPAPAPAGGQQPAKKGG